MRIERTIRMALVILALATVEEARRVHGENPPGETAKAPPAVPAPGAVARRADGLIALNPAGTVLLDKPGNRLLLKARVCLREGSLELLCCLKQTKEHESVLAVDAKAFVVHTGLLALGAKTGAPVRFDPNYQAPTGQRIDVFVNWTDAAGKARRESGQSWIRSATRRFFGEKLETLPDGLKLPPNLELRYDSKQKELSWYGPMTLEQKAKLRALTTDQAFLAAIDAFYRRGQPRQMEANWVFTGSGFYVDEESGKKLYLAEDGDLICVANFPTAMLDVAVESSAGNEGLLFEAYTERIPAKGTDVTIELIPVAAKAAPPAKPVE